MFFTFGESSAYSDHSISNFFTKRIRFRLDTSSSFAAWDLLPEVCDSAAVISFFFYRTKSGW